MQEHIKHDLGLVKFLQFLALGCTPKNEAQGDVLDVISEYVSHDSPAVRAESLVTLEQFLHYEYDENRKLQDQEGFVTELLMDEESQTLLTTLVLEEKDSNVRDALVKLIRTYHRRKLLTTGQEKRLDASLKNDNTDSTVTSTSITRKLKKLGRKIWTSFHKGELRKDCVGAALNCSPLSMGSNYKEKMTETKKMFDSLETQIKQSTSEDWVTSPTLWQSWIVFMENALTTWYGSELAALKHNKVEKTHMEIYSLVVKKVEKLLDKLDKDNENIMANILLCRGSLAYSLCNARHGKQFTLAESQWHIILDKIERLGDAAYWTKHAGLIALSYACACLPNLKFSETTVNTLIFSLNKDFAHGWELFAGGYGLGIIAHRMYRDGVKNDRTTMLLAHIVRSLVMSLLNSLDDLLSFKMHDVGFDPFRKRPKIRAKCAKDGHM
eukprot:UN25537